MSEHPFLNAGLSSNSHIKLLEALNDEEFLLYAQNLAHTAPISSTSTETYLTCDLIQGRCILPMKTLRAVIPPPHPCSLLPNAPLWMPGVTVWQGEIIAMVDLAAYLTQLPFQTHHHPMLLVVEDDSVLLGLLTVLVDEIQSFDPAQLLALSSEPIPGFSWLPQAAVESCYADMPVLRLPLIITDIVQHIKMVASHA